MASPAGQSLASTWLSSFVNGTRELLALWSGSRWQDQQFKEQAAILSVRFAILFGAVGIPTHLLLWPFDTWVFSGRPAIVSAYILWRSSFILLCISFLVVAMRWRNDPEKVNRAFLAAELAGAVVTFSIFSKLGGLNDIWIWASTMFGAMNIVSLVPWWKRCVLSGLLFVSTVGTYLIVTPSHILHPQLPAVMVSLAAFYVLLLIGGHTVYALARRGFLQELQLQRQSDELSSFNLRLADRVEEQARRIYQVLLEKEEAREEERLSIARDLHDRLGQIMTTLRTQISRLRVRCAGIDEALVAIEDLSATVDQFGSESRRILAGLRPAVLDDQGFVAAVGVLCHQFESRTNIRTEWLVEPDDLEIPSRLGPNLYAIIMECFSNVEKHSKASAVELTVTRRNAMLLVAVHDNGMGFPREKRSTTGGSGYGLLGIRERAKLLGGVATFDSSPQHGTEVIVAIPLDAAEVPDHDPLGANGGTADGPALEAGATEVLKGGST